MLQEQLKKCRTELKLMKSKYMRVKKRNIVFKAYLADIKKKWMTKTVKT